MDKAPESIRRSLMATVESDLRVSVARVGTRLVAIHAAASLVTLSLCQQFGMKIPLLGGVDLMHVFMFSGAWACQAFCGAFYLGSSFALVAAFLPRHELAWVRARLPLLGAVLLVASLLLLATMGDPLAPAYLAAWALGAWVAAMLAFKGLRSLRLWAWRLT